MKLFNPFKKKDEVSKKVSLTKAQRMVKVSAIRKHRNRIYNLENEIKDLTSKLKSLETDLSPSRQNIDKTSDNIIRRMSLLKYEIDIREGIIKWLS